MKILFDANVWIGFLRNPRQRGQFESETRRPLLFMSSIVTLELFAGCRTTRQAKALTDFLKPFEKARRIVTPDHACSAKPGWSSPDWYVMESEPHTGVKSLMMS